MPPIPSVAASRITSTGKCFFWSHSTAFGARFSAAKLSAMSRIAVWSSVRANWVIPDRARRLLPMKELRVGRRNDRRSPQGDRQRIARFEPPLESAESRCRHPAPRPAKYHSAEAPFRKAWALEASFRASAGEPAHVAVRTVGKEFPVAGDQDQVFGSRGSRDDAVRGIGGWASGEESRGH